MIEVKDLYKKYEENSVVTEVLKNFSLKITDGEKVAIMGPSGSGKSTLLHILAGLESYQSGEIIINNNDYGKLSAKEISDIRLKDYGFVYQKFYLIDSLNVYDNIIVPALALNNNFDKGYVENLCETLKIKDKMYMYPSTLSGGEGQRVCIARALVNKPGIVFADEPTGSLDRANSEIVIELLCECCKQNNQTLVVVTHDEAVAEKMDRTIVLDK